MTRADRKLERVLNRSITWGRRRWRMLVEVELGLMLKVQRWRTSPRRVLPKILNFFVSESLDDFSSLTWVLWAWNLTIYSAWPRF